MKKIIAVVDALYVEEPDLKNFRYIADKAGGSLTILFLENIYAEALLYANANAESGYFDYESAFRDKVAEHQKRMKINKQKLLNYYRNIDAVVDIREIPGDPRKALLEESCFADLLVIRDATSFAVMHKSNPTQIVKDLLTEAHCPVMVIPEQMPPFRHICFTYNGKLSSIYAIKQFIQVFDTLKNIPVSVLYVAEGNDKKLPSGKLLKEYLSHHYEEINFHLLSGHPQGMIMASVKALHQCVATFGAYGRSRVSQFFRKSHAEDILRNLPAAVFITHQ